MASSQVRIASSPPFGCVLRDRNSRDGCRESKWRKVLVSDRLNTCSSIASDENENSWLPNTLRFTRKSNFDFNYRDRDGFSAAKRPLTERKSEEMATIEEKTERRAPEETLPRPESLGEAPNLGAASLVQIWEKRLNRSNSGNNQDSTVSTGWSESGLSCNENPGSSVEEEQALRPGSETGDSVLDEERVDSLPDWHSDRTAPPSEQPSPRWSKSSDVGESERVRVADIIKRLAAVNQGAQSNDSDPEQGGCPGAAPDQAEQRIFSRARTSPRIRGRQAFTDLLMQMERERHSELNTLIERRAVSRFPQRGRIQSMLRLRSMQRGLAVQERHCLCLAPSSTSQVERLPQGSSITHLRERFSTNLEHVVTSRSSDAHYPRSSHSEITNKTNAENFKNSSTSNMPEEQTRNHKVIVIEHQDTSTVHVLSSHTIEDIQEQPSPSTSLTCLETSLEDKSLDLQETSSQDRNLDSEETSLGVRNVDPHEAVDTAEATTSFDGWDRNDIAEELEDNYSQYEEETSYDWISDISRPRSYWEDRRQEWYYEMLNSNSKNVEIRQLLERGTVTGFLASEFRERMDRLMLTRLERQTNPAGSQGGEEDEQSQLMSLIQNSQERQQQQQQLGEEIEEEEEEEEEEEQEQEQEQEEEHQEDESLISGQLNEVSDYFDQSTSSMQIPPPSLLGSWSFGDDEVGDASDRAASTSPRQDFLSHSYYHNARQCSSSVNHPSIEMELICELRGQIEQLYHEMSDLRKSLKSCMDMQMLLMQQSTKQEVHSAAGEAKNKSSYSRAAPKKGYCCICYEMQIDSLLYRCGHMCTCLKCAHELQWSSGKCPKCHAPIADVVRAYLDS